jgi:hypothetical protein
VKRILGMFPKRQAIELVENEDAAKEAAQLRDEQWSKKADAALKEHQAKIAATAEVESKPRHLTLALSDFSLIEGFRGFYERGGGDYEVEPRHSVAIRAKWRHVASSEKIFLAEMRSIRRRHSFFSTRHPAKTRPTKVMPATMGCRSISSRTSSQHSSTRLSAGT